MGKLAYPTGGLATRYPGFDGISLEISESYIWIDEADVDVVIG